MRRISPVQIDKVLGHVGYDAVESQEHEDHTIPDTRHKVQSTYCLRTAYGHGNTADEN